MDKNYKSETAKQKVIKVKNAKYEKKTCPGCGRQLFMKRTEKPKCPYCRHAWFVETGSTRVVVDKEVK